MDPGGIVDSRALSKDVPQLWKNAMKVFNLLHPLIKRIQPRLHRASESAIDLISLTMDGAYAGQTGHFDLTTKTDSSPESKDAVKQRAMWDKSIEWCGLKAEHTIIPIWCA